MKSKLLQAIVDYATGSLGEALGDGIAKALPGLAAADIQQLRAAVADLSAAVAKRGCVVLEALLKGLKPCL